MYRDILPRDVGLFLSELSNLERRIVTMLLAPIEYWVGRALWKNPRLSESERNEAFRRRTAFATEVYEDLEEREVQDVFKEIVLKATKGYERNPLGWDMSWRFTKVKEEDYERIFREATREYFENACYTPPEESDREGAGGPCG